MNKPLSYVEAIRDFHPEFKDPPILHYQLRRIAYPARLHFRNHETEEVLALAAGLDAIDEAAEAGDSEMENLLLWFDHRDDEEARLADVNGSAPVEFYEHFVCSRIEGTTLYAAVVLHALGAAAQANVLAYRMTEQNIRDPKTVEAFAQWAITAQEIVNGARFIEHGLSLAQWKGRHRAKIAASARHRPRQEIKQRFVAYYQAGQFRSKADAARRFFRDLSEQEQKTLAPTGGIDGAARTLVEALRKPPK